MSDRDPEAKRAGERHRGRVKAPTEGSRESWTIPIEKLAVMNRLGEVGAEGVADRVDRLGIDEVVSEQVKSGYVTAEDAAMQFSDEDRVGVRVRLPGAPGGYVLVLFDPASANRAAAAMLEDADEAVAEADEELAWSTIQELGSIMSSGFVDSWANMFDERIDIATPETVQHTEAEIVRATVEAGSASGASRTSSEQGSDGSDDLGVYIASQLHIPAYDIDASVYVLPDTRTFLKILGQLEVGSIQR